MLFIEVTSRLKQTFFKPENYFPLRERIYSLEKNYSTIHFPDESLLHILYVLYRFGDKTQYFYHFDF